MTKAPIVMCAAIPGCVLSATAVADDVVTKQELVARYPTLEVGDINDGPIEGVYEVADNGAIAYVTTDGRYLIRGEIIDLESQRNLTEARRAEHRAELLGRVDPKTEIVFSPTDTPVEHKIFVFTDVDCGYCRELHREMAAINALGIEVHYLSYPRTGPDTESWLRAQKVWCSKDRQGALTAAKLGAEIAAVPGCSAPSVRAHYDLGHEIGVTGTPAIYSTGGVELGGYLPPDELLAQLILLKAPAADAADSTR
jgi:thiol:disulfide interchange protein DsbC